MKRTLKEIRVLRGMSVSKIAEELGISRQSLWNKESGRYDFTAPEIQKLCKLYEVDIKDIKL